MRSQKSRKPHKFIVSNSKNPKVSLKPGMKLEVMEVKLVDPELKKVGKMAARLCGGGSTCIALIDIDPLEDPMP